MQSAWEPEDGPVVFTVSPGRRVGLAVVLFLVAVFTMIMAFVVVRHGSSPNLQAAVFCGVVLLIAALVLVYWMACRARIEFAGWQVTSTNGLSAPRTFDARGVEKLRLLRNKSSVYYAVWAQQDDRLQRITVPTAAWGNDGPAAQRLLRLIAHGSPYVDVNTPSQRALSRYAP